MLNTHMSNDTSTTNMNAIDSQYSNSDLLGSQVNNPTINLTHDFTLNDSHLGPSSGFEDLEISLEESVHTTNTLSANHNHHATRPRSVSNTSPYMTPMSELPIPGQYRLPSSHRGSFSRTRSVSPHIVSSSSATQINTNTVLPSSLFGMSAVDDDFLSTGDSQFLMPVQGNRMRSSSMNSNHSLFQEASPSSLTNSPAFLAASPLPPVSTSPYISSIDGATVNSFSNVGLDADLGSDFLTTESLHDSLDQHIPPFFSQNSQEQNDNNDSNSMNQPPHLKLDSSNIENNDFMLHTQDINAYQSQQSLFSDQVGSQRSQFQPQQQIHSSNSDSVVTTPEITIDVVQDNSPYPGSPAYTPGDYHSPVSHIHSPSSALHSPNLYSPIHTPISDVESFPYFGDESPSLHPPTNDMRRRAHSESSIGNHQLLDPINGINASGASGGRGFYLHSQQGSNVSLASAASGASYYSSVSDANNFLSPESAGGDFLSHSLINGTNESSTSLNTRNLDEPGSNGQSSISKSSLSPGSVPRRRPGRPPGSGRTAKAAADSAESRGNSRTRQRSGSSSKNKHFLEMANPSSANRKTRVHPPHHKCPKCDKTFTRAYNLQSHLRTHTNERPYKCKVCSKAFARQHDRKRHEELHTGEKKFECSGVLSDGVTRWGCGHKFARADALGRHFRTEVGRQCIRPLQEEADRERQQDRHSSNPLSMYDGNGGTPALMVSPPPTLQNESFGMVNGNDNKGINASFSQQSMIFGSDMLPQALLEQYPMLANIKLSVSPSNSYHGSSDNTM